MINTLGWKPLEDRRKKLIRVQMLYKIINKIVILPSTPVSKMKPSSYDLRDFNNQRINPLFAELTYIKYSFYPQAVKLHMEQLTPANYCHLASYSIGFQNSIT